MTLRALAREMATLKRRGQARNPSWMAATAAEVSDDDDDNDD
eukprot:CAMPEP_0197606712 /NCGR_PEP_ID=MMETSP1326-20131121/45659_1 /TAXON_ID=1155430 /ORGANISM="Genus nov. species nov., Strain RCC2288" /LENGTH=41 /DNA_ID= /DNA_START= /DNA_END= /DNA_ORIENTATION=